MLKERRALTYGTGLIAGFFLTRIVDLRFTLLRLAASSFAAGSGAALGGRFAYATQPGLLPLAPLLMLFAPAPTVFTAALFATALAARPALAQNQVANYGFGQPGTAAYEHFSFWTNNGRRSDMQYAYGKDRKDFQLRYAGRTRLHGQPGFKVRFPNGHTLYIVPSGNVLQVRTAPTTAPKTFAWEYEGPVNGVGTTCSVCVANATAAVRLLQRHYLR